jgi:hypothetical protein
MNRVYIPNGETMHSVGISGTHFLPLLLLLFGNSMLLNSDHTSLQQLSWQPYVENYTKEFFIKRLGWDPDITIYQDPKASDVIKNGCTLYCHGWGEDQTVIPRRRSWGLLPGTVIGFNFYDAVKDDRSLDLAKSSFAQKCDCRALCAVLKLLDEAQCDAIHIVGYSRGGAAIANVIRRLKEYTHNRKFFRRLGISRNQANSILARIRRGTIVLDCPLIDTRAIVKYRFPSLWGFLDYCFLPMVTLGKYAPWKDQAIDAAPFLKDFRVLVHIQHGDRIVTNICDVPFYRALRAPTTHILFADDGGGHFHRGQTLAPALHAFRKLYDAPHYDDARLLEAGGPLLADSQPAEENIEAYFLKYQD